MPAVVARAGVTVFVGVAASVQFAGSAEFNFRIIWVQDRDSYVGGVGAALCDGRVLASL